MAVIDEGTSFNSDIICGFGWYLHVKEARTVNLSFGCISCQSPPSHLHTFTPQWNCQCNSGHFMEKQIIWRGDSYINIIPLFSSAINTSKFQQTQKFSVKNKSRCQYQLWIILNLMSLVSDPFRTWDWSRDRPMRWISGEEILFFFSPGVFFFLGVVFLSGHLWCGVSVQPGLVRFTLKHI